MKNMKLFYISFATEIGFLGATVLESYDEKSVLIEANKHGLNPGGQAAIVELPYKALEASDIRIMQGKLMTKQQMLEIGAVMHGDLDDDMKNKFESIAVVI